MVTQQSQDDMKEQFAWIEASMNLEGFDPGSDPLYQDLKARILAGEITARQACDEIILKCTDPSVKNKEAA